MRSELPTTDLPNVETYTVADHPFSSKLPTATVNVESCRIEASGRVARWGGTGMVAQRAGLRPHAAYGTDLGADTAYVLSNGSIFLERQVRYLDQLTFRQIARTRITLRI